MLEFTKTPQTHTAYNESAMAIEHSRNMETRDHSNGVSPKNQRSRGNLFNYFGIIAFVAVIGLCFTVNSINAQPRFKCNKDRLHGGVVKFSTDPSSLILGQSCQITVLNRNNEKVSEKGFRITSDNKNVRGSGLSFQVASSTKREPWTHIDGTLVEESGNITISYDDCEQTYSFPFKVTQSYAFDKGYFTCKGQRREFVIAPYKNMINKTLYVVLDISTNQLHLFEAPISIDASGVRGMDGKDGAKGKNGQSGSKGTEKSPDGDNGTDGGDGSDGGDGGDGSDGGEIIVYMPRKIAGVVSINVEGGAGGNGGAGGKGGSGGSGGRGYERETGETKKGIFGTYKVKEKVGKDGKSGKDGLAGKPGRNGTPGKRGSSTINEDRNIKRYFTNINHPYFDIELIED